MGKPRKKKAHTQGRSVALPVYVGVAKQLDRTIHDLQWANQQVSDLSACLVRVLLKTGELDLDDLPPDCKLGVEAERREGGDILRLTTEAPEGQGGEDAEGQTEDHGEEQSALCSHRN